MQRNPCFIINLKNFTFESCSFDEHPKFPRNFLTNLPSILPSLETLEISVHMKNLIPSQKRLISLSLHSISVDHDLLYDLKHYRSLTCIQFIRCKFDEISSFDGFKHLTQLRSLHFIGCLGLTKPVFQSLLDFSTPLKIKTLKVVGQILGVDLLLQKIGHYLEYLELGIYGIRISNTRKLAFYSIMNHCSQIRYLHLNEIDCFNVHQFRDIIIRFNRQLKHLSLRNENHCMQDKGFKLKLCSTILEGLDQILPDSLEYLELNLMIDPYSFKTFLDGFEPVKLRKFLVKNTNKRDINDTFDVLKNFVMEKKVNQMAYQVADFFSFSNVQHTNLERSINEIRPFIKIGRYNELVEKV